MPIINEKSIDPLFSAEAIARRNAEMAAEIAAAAPRNLLVLPILKGSFVFAADMIRALYRANVAPEVEFITVSSYGGELTSGPVRLLHALQSPIAGRDILLIDDILESGKTLHYVSHLLLQQKPRRLMLATLLDKPMRRQTAIEADYVGFTCPDKFVVGYGMDAAHAFRQLPFIGTIRD